MVGRERFGLFRQSLSGYQDEIERITIAAAVKK
jgi:hypothetical protein